MTFSPVTINNRKIAPGLPPFIVAEIGGNFETFEQAQAMIDAAAAAGADAVKMQTYRADTLASKKAMFEMPNVGKCSQYELFKKYELTEELHRQIFDYARKSGIMVFSTPSHETDVEMLEKFGVTAFKIGSDDAVNIPFIEYIARKGKPTILSTGMCNMEEVKESVEAFLSTGNRQLIVLHCVTQYPTEPKDVNLRAMVTMQKELARFGVPVGWSDHVIGIEVCLAAVALGAAVIEKHFTTSRNLPGPDQMLSATPEEMKEFVRLSKNIVDSMGNENKEPSEAERITRRNNRKSIVAEKDITKGTQITKDMVAIKRPGTGIEPKHLDKVIGKKTRHDIEKEDILQWDDLE